LVWLDFCVLYGCRLFEASADFLVLLADGDDLSQPGRLGWFLG